MEEFKTLPITNERGYFEIRLESIGGLGANLCGKMLGELGANYLNINASSFSSYGSEKRGSPVKAYIRWANADQEISISSPVVRPHILGLFHEAMIGKLPVTQGVNKESKIVINTDKSPKEMREALRLHGGEIYCVDAQELAMETKSRVNMILLGAIAKAAGFIPLDTVKQMVTDTIGEKYPALLENNLKGVEAGFSKAEMEFFSPEAEYEEVPYQEEEQKIGYENAPIGGVNPAPGSTITNDLSASRQGYIPLFIKERCINCGLCEITCPDMVFQFEKGQYKGREMPVNLGPDYHYCKGCLRCVSICPTNALVCGKEAEHKELKGQVLSKELPDEIHVYEDVGANSYVTSESDENERRMGGGIV